MDGLQALVPRVLAELLHAGPMSQGKLEVAWRASVGEGLSRVTTVCLRPNGLVEVTPVDQRWAGEIKRSASMILSRLQWLLGDGCVSRISVL